MDSCANKHHSQPSEQCIHTGPVRREVKAGASLVLNGKESTCQCRRRGFKPWCGKIPHATEQLSRCTTEPVLSSPGVATTGPTSCNYWSPGTLGPVLCERSHCNEKPAHPNERVTSRQQRPSTAKIKLLKKKKTWVKGNLWGLPWWLRW